MRGIIGFPVIVSGLHGRLTAACFEGDSRNIDLCFAHVSQPYGELALAWSLRDFPDRGCREKLAHHT